MSKSSNYLRITLTKSPIGSKPKNAACLHALGLWRMGRTIEKPNTPAIRGMLKNIKHLLTIQEM
jgi:large subunit ribosomal protein L30